MDFFVEEWTDKIRRKPGRMEKKMLNRLIIMKMALLKRPKNTN